MPFNKEFNGIRLTNKGLLKPTNNVYIADSSGFQYLPAKGISFTIMANAYNVGINVKNEHSY